MHRMGAHRFGTCISAPPKAAARFRAAAVGNSHLSAKFTAVAERSTGNSAPLLANYFFSSLAATTCRDQMPDGLCGRDQA
jgi:hypothetical protein